MCLTALFFSLLRPSMVSLPSRMFHRAPLRSACRTHATTSRVFVVHAPDLSLPASPTPDLHNWATIFSYGELTSSCRWFWSALRPPGWCLSPMVLFKPLSMLFLLWRFTFKYVAAVVSQWRFETSWGIIRGLCLLEVLRNLLRFEPLLLLNFLGVWVKNV